jgi:hypothetical protein
VLPRNSNLTQSPSWVADKSVKSEEDEEEEEEEEEDGVVAL